MTGTFHTHDHATGNPLTRKCIRCARILPRAQFLMQETDSQAKRYGRGAREIPGVALSNGRFLRGYVRPPRRAQRHSMICIDCRAPKPRPTHPLRTPTARVVLSQISNRLKRLAYLRRAPTPSYLTPTQVHARQYWMGVKRGMLHRAAMLARARSKAGKPCPKEWQQLLTKQERSTLWALHSALPWMHGPQHPVY